MEFLLTNYRRSGIIAILFLIHFFVTAQNRVVTGSVTGPDQLPLIGATIIEKGTTKGSVTDLNGYYSIETGGEESILVFTYIGYEDAEVLVADQSIINVILAESSTELDELVVIGYGVQKKSDLTGAVSMVDGEVLNKSNPVNIGQALQGRVAGLSVTTSSGQPGSNTSIKIRGISSISNSTDPLFVIDGVLTEGRSAMSNLNPEEIESISVLKDASSAAIYGSRAANGVIVITTRRGKSGKTQVSFSSYGGITRIPRMFDIMNADEYASFSEAAWVAFIQENPGASRPDVFSDSARAANGAEDNNWLDLVTQTGIKQNYNLSVSSGTEKLNYLFGLNYYNETGVLLKTGYERLTARFNSDLQINNWLKVGESMSLSYGSSEFTSHKGENPWRLGIISSPLMPVNDSTNIGGYAGPFDYITGPNDKSNPVAEQMLNDNFYTSNQLLGNIYAQIRLLEGLTYKVDVGVRHDIGYSYQYSPEYELARAWSNPSSLLSESYSRTTNIQLSNLITYIKSINDHNIAVLLGQSMETENARSLGASGREIAFDKRVMSLAQTVTSASGQEFDDRFASYFGRLNYDYLGKYLLTFTYRIDGSSRFGPGYRWGRFPSFSVGWKINEDLLQMVEEVNLLKLRVGYGVIGNANIGRYLYIDRINNPLETRYPFGSDEEIYYGGTIIRSFANPGIQWEEAKMLNVGIDAGLFENRVLASVEYYYKDQDGMLIEQQQLRFFGRQQEDARQPANLGRILNKGIEASLTYRKMEGSFNYQVTANLTTIENIVKYLPDGESLINDITITTEGQTIGSFYGWVAERIIQENDFDENGRYRHAKQNNATAPGDIKFKDLNNDGFITTADQTIIGKPVPNLIYGLNLDLYYGNFDFTIFLEGVQGNHIYNAIRSEIGLATEPTTKNWNRLREVMEYWTPDKPSTEMTRASVVDVNENRRTSSWFIEDGSYLRIKNAQIGYTVKQDLVPGINGLRIYFSMTNLYTITKYSGLDPEVNSDSPVSSGIDGGRYPVPRSFIGGVQFNF